MCSPDFSLGCYLQKGRSLIFATKFEEKSLQLIQKRSILDGETLIRATQSHAERELHHVRTLFRKVRVLFEMGLGQKFVIIPRVGSSQPLFDQENFIQKYKNVHFLSFQIKKISYGWGHSRVIPLFTPSQKYAWVVSTPPSQC